MSSEPLHRTLWRANQPLVDACSAHPFVGGLGDGSLDRDAFRGYVAQDAFFLRAFLSAYALAAAKAVDRTDVVRSLHQLIGGVLDELELHARYAETLGIDLLDVQPHPATSAYTDFLLRTAWTSGVGEILAAMTPCMRLYAHLGQELAAAGSSPDNPYRDWIETYSSPEFEALAAKLESLLDDVADPGPEVAGAYRYALQCEVNFFSANLGSDR